MNWPESGRGAKTLAANAAADGGWLRLWQKAGRTAGGTQGACREYYGVFKRRGHQAVRHGWDGHWVLAGEVAGCLSCRRAFELVGERVPAMKPASLSFFLLSVVRMTA